MAGKLSSKIKDAATNLRKNQTNAPAGGATEQAFAGAAAAQGKGVSGPSGQSNIGEVLGVQGVRAQGEQAAQAMDQQAGQAQVQEVEQDSKQKQFKVQQRSQLLEGDQKYNQGIEDQFLKYKEHGLDMNAEEENLALEDLGAKLALKDKQYQAHLSRTGAEGRLHDELAFKEESEKLIQGEALSTFRKELDFLVEQNDLDLQNIEDLAQIDLDSALLVANAAIEEDMNAQRSQGYSDLAEGGMTAYGAYEDSTKKKKKTSPPDDFIDKEFG